VLILLVVAIGASKTLMGSSMASSPKNKEAQVYGKSGGDDISGISGRKQDAEVTLAKLQEDLKALISGNVSVLQAKGKENSKLVSNTVELAKEIKDNMKGLAESNTKESDEHPGSASSGLF